MRLNCDAILFDLDGTLVDTAADLAAALNAALGPLGRRAFTAEQTKPLIGGGLPNLVTQGLEASGGMPAPAEFEAAVKRAYARYDTHYADASRPCPGVAATLGALQGAFKMGVCTNKPEQFSRKILTALGLAPYLPVVVGGDTLPVKKPDPKMAFAVMERLGATPARSVLVGDSVTDVRLARNAGIPVVLVAGGYTTVPASELGADAVVGGFAELPGLLRR